MRRLIKLSILAVLCGSICPGLVVAESQSNAEGNFWKGLAGSRKEMAASLVKEILAEGAADKDDSSRIETMCSQALRSASTDNKQATLIDFFGKDGYHSLEKLYISQLSSALPSERYHVILTLGDLHSVASRQALEEHVFGYGTYIQAGALVALTKIGAPDAKELLLGMVLSGMLPSQLNARAITSLEYADVQLVSALAPVILDRNTDIMSASRLISSITLRTDGKEILMMIVEKYCKDVPDQALMSVDALCQNHIIRSVLTEGEKSPDLYLSDEKFVRLLEMYSKYNLNKGLYLRALRVLEYSGYGAEYFEEMLSEEKLPEGKRKELERIVARIKAGKRLESVRK